MKIQVSRSRFTVTARVRAAVQVLNNGILKNLELTKSLQRHRSPRFCRGGWAAFALILALCGTMRPAAMAQSAQNNSQGHLPAATLTSITMTPSSVTTTPGNSGQLTATGNYSDGSKKNVNTTASWASSATSVATVNATGLATAVAAGTANITATIGTISGSAKVTVSGVVLKSITVTPSLPSVAAGYIEQFTATGTYSDGSKKDLTGTATWNSSATSVATAVPGGKVICTSPGASTITVLSGTVTGSTQLTVTTPVLTSISVTPTAVAVAPGASLQFTATGMYSNGSTQNLTNALVWSSSAPQFVTINSTGLATGVAKGSAILTATSGAIKGGTGLTVTTATRSIPNFQHIIVVIQENRSPDHMFQGLCTPPYGTSNSCSITPSGSQYNIQTSNWLDKTSSTGYTQPSPVALAGGYDLVHSHGGFQAMCDIGPNGACKMDGAAYVGCGSQTCPPKPEYAYVDNSTGIMNPLLSMTTQYAWGNYFFQTNQGASFPAHQFLFSGTAAPSADDDAAGIFTSTNMLQAGAGAGCEAGTGTTVALVGPAGQVQNLYPPIFPCLEHQSMADLLDPAGISWKYYAATGPLSIWTGPNAIQHLCVPNKPEGGQCTGSDFLNNVISNSSQVLTDIGACSLANVAWVTPTAPNSDHPTSNTGGGPSWIASIVNAIGNNPKCPNGETYWNNTAIFITWDDWGGWYDHEAPTLLGEPQGDDQYGFRVPLIVVSAYTPTGYVDNTRTDFGSILRFIEYNFGFSEGALNFADARAQADMTEYFNLNQAPRSFQKIAAPLDAAHFTNDPTPPEEPDEY